MKVVLGAIVVIAGVALNGQEERTVWSGVYTEVQSKRGEAIYMEMCANCHGAELEGLDMSPPLAGATFSSNWNELTLGDLADRIRISMPADRPGTMTRAQVADVMAYMLSANKFPTGPTELPQVVPLLKQIRIIAEKPAPAH
jgi:S-disulfanyl-L-cysteine oxidoreductase SoxD